VNLFKKINKRAKKQKNIDLSLEKRKRIWYNELKESNGKS
jgi:hypothetical protein